MFRLFFAESLILMGFFLSDIKVLLSKTSEDILHVFRLDDNLFWMNEISCSGLLSLKIQLIYEYVDPDKKKKDTNLQFFFQKYIILYQKEKKS